MDDRQAVDSPAVDLPGVDVNVVLEYLRQLVHPRGWEDAVTIATQRAQLEAVAGELSKARLRIDELEIEVTALRSAALPAGGVVPS